MRDLLHKSLGDAYETVTERVGDMRSAGIARTAVAKGGAVTAEQRAARLECRANEDGTYHVSGYAATWGTAYDVAGGAPVGWSETVARGAVDKSLSENADVRFLTNHEGLPLARTSSGTMTVRSDDLGLFVDIPALDPANPKAQELISALSRGDVNEMSWAFQVTRQSWNADYTERTIREAKVIDVSAVTYPANPATIIGMRSERTRAERRDLDMSMFTPRQAAQYAADESLVEMFGKYDKTTGADGAHYVDASPFPGLVCSSCAFYSGPRGCEIVDGDIAPEGICKRWIIPASLLTEQPADPATDPAADPAAGPATDPVAQASARSGFPLSLARAQADAL